MNLFEKYCVLSDSALHNPFTVLQVPTPVKEMCPPRAILCFRTDPLPLMRKRATQKSIALILYPH